MFTGAMPIGGQSIRGDKDAVRGPSPATGQEMAAPRRCRGTAPTTFGEPASKSRTAQGRY